MAKHDLSLYMKSLTAQIQAEYELIQSHVHEDPGTAGDHGEENWKDIIQAWLPSNYHVVTKGRILNHEGKLSPQIDVLVLKPSYPSRLLSKKYYLAGGVAAAFECKTTLEPKHIKKALENSVKITKMLPIRRGTPYKELSSSIIYGLLAHSHYWKSSREKAVSRLQNHIRDKDKAIIKHPREMLDFICIANLATFVSRKTIFHEGVFGRDDCVNTGYSKHFADHNNPQLTPLGTLIANLFIKLAWSDSSLRDLANYFGMTEISIRGGGPLRSYDLNVYSDLIRDEIKKVYEETEYSSPFSGYFGWSEWSIQIA